MPTCFVLEVMQLEQWTSSACSCDKPLAAATAHCIKLTLCLVQISLLATGLAHLFCGMLGATLSEVGSLKPI